MIMMITFSVNEPMDLMTLSVAVNSELDNYLKTYETCIVALVIL